MLALHEVRVLIRYLINIVSKQELLFSCTSIFRGK